MTLDKSLFIRYFGIWVTIIVFTPKYGFSENIAEHLIDHNLIKEQDRDSIMIVKAPKSAMVRSLVFPGWGQWYNGKKLKSAIIFSAEVGVFTGILVQNRRLSGSSDPAQRAFYRDDRNKLIWWLGGVIIYSMLDAYVDAYLLNFNVEMDINKSSGKSALLRVEFTIPFR